MKDINEQIGLSELKDILEQKNEDVVYATRENESIYDIEPGYYFFLGNPGTGKTTSAKLFSECLRELGITKTSNFFECTAKDLIGEYVGHTDKKTAGLLEKARNGVLFIDEAYSLSHSNSSHSDSSFEKKALDEIVSFMDKPENRRTCCIIFAGYKDEMKRLYDSNAGLKSRIQEVYFDDFTAEELYSILALFFSKGGFTVEEGVKDYYMPIFETMTQMQYYANGRTARKVFDKTLANYKRRINRTKGIKDEDKQRILLKDVISEEESYKIVKSL